MQASSHAKRSQSKKTVDYPIRVSDHALEKLREIGVDTQHSDGWLKDRIVVQVWDQIKEQDAGLCPQLGGRADYIAELPPDVILGLKVLCHAIVVENEVPGTDNAQWAITTILDNASYNARREMAEAGGLQELRREVEERLYTDLATGQVLVVVLREDGSFAGLRGFSEKGEAESYVNERLTEMGIESIRVYGLRPLQTRVLIGG